MTKNNNHECSRDCILLKEKFCNLMVDFVKTNLLILEEDYYDFMVFGKSKFYTVSGATNKKYLNDEMNMKSLIATNLTDYMNDMYKDVKNNNMHKPHLKTYNEIKELSSQTNDSLMNLLYVYMLMLSKKINRRKLITDTKDQYMDLINKQINIHQSELKKIIAKNYHIEFIQIENELYKKNFFSIGETLNILSYPY